MVCPAAAAAAVQIIQSAVGGTGSGRKPRNRIHTLCGPWKRNVDGTPMHILVNLDDAPKVERTYRSGDLHHERAQRATYSSETLENGSG